jgi:hypothetical protein
MATHIWPDDTETLAVNAFKDEGVFLFKAQRTADELSRRVLSAHPNVKRFTLSRAEMADYAYLLARAVAVASEYHLGAAE